MSGTQIQIYEKELGLRLPTFEDVLKPIGMPPARLIRTVLIALDRSDKLRECSMESVMSSAVTLACLGLEADGVTGQGFMIPFRVKGTPTAQTVIGYKGYNTMASRSGYSIRGAPVYEEDKFDIDMGRPHPISHRPDFKTPIAQRKMIGVYALASSHHAPDIPVWMTLDEVLAVRKKSKGAWYGDGNAKKDSPWHDIGDGESTGSGVGFIAMAEKTAKRRLQRSMPLNTFVRGAVMEEAFEERGLHSYIDPKEGIVIEGSAVTRDDGVSAPLTESEADGLLSAREVFAIEFGNRTAMADNIDDWQTKMLHVIDTKPVDQVKRFRQLNGTVMADLHSRGFARQVGHVDTAFAKKVGQ